jgi:hypothetical protein
MVERCGSDDGGGPSSSSSSSSSSGGSRIISNSSNSISNELLYIRYTVYAVQSSMQLHRLLVESPFTSCFPVNSLHVSTAQGLSQLCMMIFVKSCTVCNKSKVKSNRPFRPIGM